jgi:hypothetical protein
MEEVAVGWAKSPAVSAPLRTLVRDFAHASVFHPFASAKTTLRFDISRIHATDFIAA